MPTGDAPSSGGGQEPNTSSTLADFVRALRLYQWVKNLLVFVAPAAAHTLLQPEVLRPSVLAFLSFGLAASGLYLLNDVADLDADREHPIKRRRPFASGRLPLSYARWAPVSLVAGALVAFSVSPATGLMLLGYIGLTSLYSMWLKTQPLVDVFCLAALYSVRLLAGGVATETPVSVWLLSFSGFIFLSLALLKRTAELVTVESAVENGIRRRGYASEDQPLLLMMGTSCSVGASLVLAIYVDSEVARTMYPSHPDVLWGIVPLTLFWQFRMWHSAVRGRIQADPILYAARDWVSWLVLLASTALVFGASVPWPL